MNFLFGVVVEEIIIVFVVVVAVVAVVVFDDEVGSFAFFLLRKLQLYPLLCVFGGDMVA